MSTHETSTHATSAAPTSVVVENAPRTIESYVTSPVPVWVNRIGTPYLRRKGRRSRSLSEARG